MSLPSSACLTSEKKFVLPVTGKTGREERREGEKNEERKRFQKKEEEKK